MCAIQVKQLTHDLRFNVAQLLKEGTGAYRNFTVESPALDLSTDNIAMVAPLTGSLKFLSAGQNILVSGTLSSRIEKPCGRCIEPFQAPITLELEEEFYPSVDIHTGHALHDHTEEDEANQIDELHQLDLQEIIRQESLIASELIYYCRVDCKGLCPQCGQDRNKIQCDCQTEQIDARWAGLLALKEETEE